MTTPPNKIELPPKMKAPWYDPEVSISRPATQNKNNRRRPVDEQHRIWKIEVNQSTSMTEFEQ
ncbi:hypothetical protein DPMN_153434 [Dreissena polymorpha]|uniref:Uncharacterized protein n=1 Tax=Dreissena polymorpha TaxID=45954 RepID=A0A9D4J8X2_DREPO|nr:hypothetical protein DPMN_153434 [Dreissena polymorpha]